MTQPTITKINPAKVVHAYSGRPGCMCGCLGKHSYRPEAKGPGYEVERSDRSVDSVVRNMNSLVAKGEATFSIDVDEKTGKASDYVYIDLPNRSYVAYFS